MVTLELYNQNTVKSQWCPGCGDFAVIKSLKEALVSFFGRTGRLKGTCGGARDVLGACLAYLAASAARVVMVNLEDLWLETDPQNTPGTREERPNWRRKARYAFETFCQLPHVVETLREVDRQRKLAAGAG